MLQIREKLQIFTENKNNKASRTYLAMVFSLFIIGISQMRAQKIKIIWSEKPNIYYSLRGDSLLLKINLQTRDSSVILHRDSLKLRPKPKIAQVYFFKGEQKVLLFYNAQRVWRYKSKGDYLIYDLAKSKLRKLGRGLKAGSLTALEIAPNGNFVAYSSGNNVYIEDLRSANLSPLQVTRDGKADIFNGTFDWSYEEEFGARGGIRWSADSRFVAFWRINARQMPDFLMINNTDSTYPFLTHIPYPKVGYPIAEASILFYSLANKRTTKLQIPESPNANFITQLAAYPKGSKFLLQTLDRRQQHSKIYSFDCNQAQQQFSKQLLYQEKNSAWLENLPFSDRFHAQASQQEPWWWVNKKGDFLLFNEEGRYRNLIFVSAEGKYRRLTPDNYDVISVERIDTARKQVYFIASPDNSSERYLYSLDYLQGTEANRVTPLFFQGVNNYKISPTGKFAYHTFSSYQVANLQEFVSLPEHKSLSYSADYVQNYLDSNKRVHKNDGISFFQLNTAEGTQLDGFMCKPRNFDSTRKYPVLFYVYGEPAAQTTLNSFSNTHHGQSNTCASLFEGEQDFVYVVLDNRGSPAPKGNSWRKAIYKQLGTVNVRDQALGAQSFLAQHKFVDTSRVGVWGWSGGGSVTLHLLFKYPQIYKMGISIAPLTDLTTYDNIYEERYMGLISDSDGLVRYQKASPISYANLLKGHLLLIHGTGDDNVHYQNSERLINALIKANKVFSFMAYPNRSHSINEGQGTTPHLRKTFTNFVRQFLLK